MTVISTAFATNHDRVPRQNTRSYVFVNGDHADDGGPDMNYHPRFNHLQSSLAAEVKAEVRIVLDMASVG